ncbi:MAG TPA: hypothetical protein VNN10_13765 [Dehalococcoidia bacterium]|nr:hypothetical protein [Dehalococcoidia bacterium]
MATEVSEREDGPRTRPRSRRTAEEAAFRASVEERLRNLEAEIGEVKLRLNGLLFFIASTVIGQVLIGVIG